MFLKMWVWRSLMVCHLLALLAIARSDECNRRITRQFYSKEIQMVRVENHFGNVFVRKHSNDSETCVLVEVDLVGTLLHAANLPIVFTDSGGQAMVMVGELAEDSSSVQPSLFSSWTLSLPLIAALVFQRKTFAVATLMLFAVWMSVTVAQDRCPSGDVEVFMPKNSCFSVIDNQDGRSTSVDIVECKVENQPRVVSCSVSGYLYPNCTQGTTGVQLSWDVTFSAATNNSLSMSDNPILIEWSVKAVNCTTCLVTTPFTTVLELHEIADIRNFQSWSKTLPSNNLPLTNSSTVTFLLRVDTPREGYSIPRECDGPDGSTIFTNAVPFNPGPLHGQLSLNTTTFNTYQPVFVMAAREVCFLLRGFENDVCDILSYRASLGTTICGNDSIDFTTLQTMPNNADTKRACLQSDRDLDVGRYFVTIEAVDHAGLSTVVCPNVTFVVDNVLPQFVSVTRTCFTGQNNNFEERLSWEIQALSGIVMIQYAISNTNSSYNFMEFPTPVGPYQLDYNLQPLLQGHSGIIYFTLQAESGVGLTTIYSTRADQICSDK